MTCCLRLAAASLVSINTGCICGHAYSDYSQEIRLRVSDVATNAPSSDAQVSVSPVYEDKPVEASSAKGTTNDAGMTCITIHKMQMQGVVVFPLYFWLEKPKDLTDEHVYEIGIDRDGVVEQIRGTMTSESTLAGQKYIVNILDKGKPQKVSSSKSN